MFWSMGARLRVGEKREVLIGINTCKDIINIIFKFLIFNK